MLTRALQQRPAARRALALGSADLAPLLPAPALHEAPSQLQRSASELVRAEFERCSHSVSRTARALGSSRTTVYRHLRHLRH